MLWEYSSDGAHIKLSVRGIIHEKGFKVNPKMCEQVFPKNDLVYCNRHQVVLTFTLGLNETQLQYQWKRLNILKEQDKLKPKIYII